LFVQMRDQAGERVVQRTGGFAGLNQIDRGRIEHSGEIAHGAGERRAFAQTFPESRAQHAQRRFLDAQRQQANCLAGGHSAGGEIVQRLEQRQPLFAVRRAASG
jgi:hypothetical protein